MELRLLGRVMVAVGDRLLEVGSPRQCEVLACLAVEAGRLVPADLLLDRIWGPDAPSSSRRTLHTYIARLRRLLRQADGGRDAVCLDFGSGGYVLRIPSDRVDVHRFRSMVDRAVRPDVDDPERARLLRAALDLWDGEPLAGLPGSWAARVRDSWLQQRRDAVVAWARSELRLGRPAVVIGPLSELLDEYPYVEPVAATLFDALHAAGRGAEALARFAEVRRRLVDDLGTEPGPGLQQVHRLILRGDPAAAGASSTVEPARVPAQLPADVAGFTGRQAELAGLDAMFGADAAEAPVITVLSGAAGVGKTATAIHWARRRLDRFPDGQLYVNLRGYDPEQPMTAGEALTHLLEALGVTGAAVPFEADARAARYRTEIAGRRMLVVLDNAVDVDQVRPLVPGTGSCSVIVTSRDSLPGLVALDGARRLELNVLPTADARSLLRRLIGPKVDAEPDATAMLTDLCGGLPLALRLAAEHAAARGATLADLVIGLTDQRRRIDLLDVGGDPRAAVRTVFSWSMRHLPAPVARMFALLSLHPGAGIDEWAAAALAGVDAADAGAMLQVLVRAHLVHRAKAGRYHLHDLIRAYARNVAGGRDADELGAALRRLAEYYLGTSVAAMTVLFPDDPHRLLRVRLPAMPGPEFGDAATAREWLNVERPNLVAVAAQAANHSPAYSVDLSITVYRYLDGGYHTDALVVHEHARQAAKRAGDRLGEAHAMLGLGLAHLRLARYAAADDHLRRAAVAFRRLGDTVGEARVVINLGILQGRLGRLDRAGEHQERALALFRRIGDHAGVGKTLNNLGSVDLRRGRGRVALGRHMAALAVWRRAEDPIGVAQALKGLGNVELGLGRYERAARYYRQALDLCRQAGNRTGEAIVLFGLGELHTHRREPGLALDHHRQALLLARRTGEREMEAFALNGIGDAARCAGDLTRAFAEYHAALAIATELACPELEIRTHTGLGDAYTSCGDTGLAHEHYARAITLRSAAGHVGPRRRRTARRRPVRRPLSAGRRRSG
jgi:DNA-binding SARP family transcriptional activator/tetratricopeptide (TPR) repeat protein